MIKHRFDARKALEVILYIAGRCPGMYTALKILYLADKEHLSRYGRLICGDSYVAMRHGPVPSGTYDIVKYARGDGFCLPEIPVAEAFTVRQGRTIDRLREPNLDLLSESDIECLDSAIERYGQMSFQELKRLTHDAAFKSSDENDFIALEDIVKTLSNRDLLLDYLQDA